MVAIVVVEENACREKQPVIREQALDPELVINERLFSDLLDQGDLGLLIERAGAIAGGDTPVDEGIVAG